MLDPVAVKCPGCGRSDTDCLTNLGGLEKDPCYVPAMASYPSSKLHLSSLDDHVATTPINKSDECTPYRSRIAISSDYAFARPRSARPAPMASTLARSPPRLLRCITFVRQFWLAKRLNHTAGSTHPPSTCSPCSPFLQNPSVIQTHSPPPPLSRKWSVRSVTNRAFSFTYYLSFTVVVLLGTQLP